jgi:hypothetical protein
MLQFDTFAEGANALGGIDAVVASYIGFQADLFSPSN